MIVCLFVCLFVVGGGVVYDIILTVLQARVETRKLFRQVAGPKVANFMWQALVCVCVW